MCDNPPYAFQLEGLIDAYAYEKRCPLLPSPVLIFFLSDL